MNVVIQYPSANNADWDPLRAEFPDDIFTWVTEADASMPELASAEVIATNSPLGSGVLAAAPNVSWIQVLSAGVERHLRNPELAGREIVMTNARVLLGSHVAETGIALLTGLSRGIVPATLNKQQRRWDNSYGAELDELTGKRALVVGAGGIGRALARRLHGLEVVVRAVDVYPQEPDAYIQEVREVKELHAMLPETDILAICCPITEATYHLVDQRAFELLPDGAYLLNISRGGVVDTRALVDALKSGKLRGAALDVLEEEPPSPDHEIWGLGNVILTPHNGGDSPKRITRLCELLTENLRRYKSGKMLQYVVDVQAGF